MSITTDQPDRDIAEALIAAGLAPDDVFRASLAAELESIAAGDNVAVLSTPPADHHRSRWAAFGAVAAVVAIVVVGILIIGPDGGDDGAPTTLPPPDETDSDAPQLDPDALTDLALAEALLGRQWIQVERFDQPVSTSVSATIDVLGVAPSLGVNGHDGCNVYGVNLTIDGNAITVSDRSPDRFECQYETLALTSGQRIQIVPGVATFDLFDETGDAIARFADLDTLEPATADDLPGTWLLDGGNMVSLTDFGTGQTPCMQLQWDLDSGQLTSETFDFGLCPTPSERSPEDEVIVVADELLTMGAGVRRVGSNLLLIREFRAVILYSLPDVEVDPNGVTLAAGTAFGITPGLGVDPEATVATVTAALGLPTDDTGWVDPETLLADGERRPFALACDLNEYRLVRWGDLEFSFARTGSRTALAYWGVGDSELLRAGAPSAADRLPEPEPSDLATEHGVRVGDSRASIPRVLGVGGRTIVGTDPAVPEEFIVSIVSRAEARPLSGDETFRGGSYHVIGDEIVGFGTTMGACG